MPRDELNESLSLSIRELSLHIDSTALELNPGCSCGLFDDLMDMSERLSKMADAIEDPSLNGEHVHCSRIHQAYSNRRH